MVLVVARPLQPAELVEALVGHPGVDRRKRAELVPRVLGGLPAPVGAHPPGDLLDDPEVIASLARRLERLADTLDPSLTVRDRALALRPGRGRREDDVGELPRRGQEDVLD